jgi:hypothetical protein
MHLITIQKVKSNVQSVCRQSADIIDTRLTLKPSVSPNPNYVIVVIVTVQNMFACCLYCNHQVHRDFLITLCNKYRLLRHYIKYDYHNKKRLFH